MATVAISDLQCGVTYALIAEGMSNGTFVGPASSHENITTGPCPVITSECIATYVAVVICYYVIYYIIKKYHIQVVFCELRGPHSICSPCRLLPNCMWINLMS